MEIQKVSGIFDRFGSYQKGALIGLLLGTVSFFNLPSLNSFLTSLVASIIVFGLLGYVKGRYGSKWAGFGFLLALMAFIALGTSTCNMMAVIHDPARNTLTGEVDGYGGFDGFRLMTGCDKGEYPWYYEDLSENEVDSFCEDNSDANYCMRENAIEEARRNSGINP